MIFTFFKARGLSVGNSLVEEDKLDLAKSLEEAAKKKGMLSVSPLSLFAHDQKAEDLELLGSEEHCLYEEARTPGLSPVAAAFRSGGGITSCFARQPAFMGQTESQRWLG